jgi:hypothetical protein
MLVKLINEDFSCSLKRLLNFLLFLYNIIPRDTPLNSSLDRVLGCLSSSYNDES